MSDFQTIPSETLEKWRALKKTDRKAWTRDFFNLLNPKTMDLVDEFYHPDAVLEDPIGRQNGRQEVRRYYESIYGPVTAIIFEFGEGVSEGNRLSLPWTMRFRSKKLKRNKEISVEGISLIRFDPESHQAIHHRDYYDLGEMVHEHIPVIGGLFRWIKKKLD
jgi:hypothetical protein